MYLYADNELFRVLAGLGIFFGCVRVCEVCLCGCYYWPETHDLEAILEIAGLCFVLILWGARAATCIQKNP